MLAGAIVACAMASFHLVSAFVARPYAIVVSQLVLLAIPVSAAALVPPRAGRWAAMRDRLGLRAPRAIYLVAGALIGATAWYVNWRIISWLDIRGDTRALEEASEEPPLVVALLMLAVIPPICEETLFRGVLARSLAAYIPPVAAVATSAVLFSAYHLSLAQAGPTFTLGLAFGYLAIRADSVVPSVIAHALNNGVAIAIARGEVRGLDHWLGAHGTPALVVCLLATASGVALIALGGRPT